MVHAIRKLVGTCNRLVVGSNPTSRARQYYRFKKSDRSRKLELNLGKEKAGRNFLYRPACVDYELTAWISFHQRVIFRASELMKRTGFLITKPSKSVILSFSWSSG